MTFFDGARGRMFYRNWLVDDPAATVVFLHGFGEHSGLYDRYAAALNARGISLWALDQIGPGQSDGPRGQGSLYPHRSAHTSDPRAKPGKTRASTAHKHDPRAYPANLARQLHM